MNPKTDPSPRMVTARRRVARARALLAAARRDVAKTLHRRAQDEHAPAWVKAINKRARRVALFDVYLAEKHLEAMLTAETDLLLEIDRIERRRLGLR